LALDGHVILGPHKSDGDTWECDDRDVCNGAFVDGSYVYVGSQEFPYVVGCWGPGPDNQYAPTCTDNGCSGSTSTDDSSDTTTDDSSDTTTDDSSDTTTDTAEDESADSGFTTDLGAIESIVLSSAALIVATAALF